MDSRALIRSSTGGWVENIEAILLPLNGLLIYKEAVAVEASLNGVESLLIFLRALIRPDGCRVKEILEASAKYSLLREMAN